MNKALTFVACGFLLTGMTFAQTANSDSTTSLTPANPIAVHVAPWAAENVQHAYGLPEMKSNVQGRLELTNTGLNFHANEREYIIPWADTIAVSHGVERVERWGTKGRLLRMAIPDGGGLAAAGFMHHNITELTVEFRDVRGAYHGAVFLLSEKDATHVLEVYSRDVQPLKTETESTPTSPVGACARTSGPKSVLVFLPKWNNVDVPAAYRAMVYEHLVDRMQHVKGVVRVIREGETATVCPDYSVTTSIMSFRPGNQVMRAMTGPVGLFVGTTQLTFQVTVKNAAGTLNTVQDFKANVRGEGESKNIADGVGKKIAKSYTKPVKQFEESSSTIGTTGSPDKEAR